MDTSMLPFQFLKLTKENYDNWSIRMKEMLGSQAIWDVVEKSFEQPDNEHALSQTQKDDLRKAW